jgi:spore coat polysaccharide biosynthesis predicted glycosyltransferase SpsG
MTHSQDVILELNRTHSWQLAEQLTLEQVTQILAEKLNALIRDDFGALVQLLYRIDIEEPRLRYLLQHHKGEDAGKLIAGLIIQRMEQKILTRRQFTEKDNNIPEEDRW